MSHTLYRALSGQERATALNRGALLSTILRYGGPDLGLESVLALHDS